MGGGALKQKKKEKKEKDTKLDNKINLRHGTPWYGQYVCAEISAENWQQVLVPKGFAHGFLTLQPNTAVMYRVTTHYSPAHDAGIRWNDPDIGIDWPINENEAVLSDKDSTLPFLSDCDTLFVYEAK